VSTSEFLRRQATTALRLASLCVDAKVAVHLKLTAAEMLQEAIKLEAAQSVSPSPANALAPAPQITDGTKQE
jgi:hypothetical protein